MNTIKITPNLLSEYQCTSGKFIYHIAESNRIEKIDSVARIESNRNFFCPNWNALSRTVSYHNTAQIGVTSLMAVLWTCSAFAGPAAIGACTPYRELHCHA